MKRNFEDLSKEELVELLVAQERPKKLGLVWEHRDEQVVEDCKNNFPIIREIPELGHSQDQASGNNALIEGDNYHSLLTLGFTHQGKFDVIYADPPYNTGARDWKYNNKFVDASDSFRHSKWLSFMSHRLKLAKELLAQDGIICVTIDDYELPRLWMLMDEIFGEENYLGTAVIRINPGGRKSKRKLAAQHEYALFFGKHPDTKVAPFEVEPESKSHKFVRAEDGRWFEYRNLRKEGQDSLATKKDGTLSHRYYPIYLDPASGRLSSTETLPMEIWPIDTKGQKRIWRRDKSAVDQLFEDGYLEAKETKFGWQVNYRNFLDNPTETPKSLWDDKSYSASEHGTGTLDKVMGESGTFPFPKSLYAVMDAIRVCSPKKDALILDFFAGSGTTGQAVLELNRQDGGTRSFVLCTNNENEIAREVTRVRVKNAIDGYVGSEPHVNGFRYFQTDFVAPGKTADQSRKKVVGAAVDLLRFREGCFTPGLVTEAYGFYSTQNRLLGVLFDETELESFKEEIRNQSHAEKITIYVFSLTQDSYESDFLNLDIPLELKAVPEAILENYKRSLQLAKKGRLGQ